MRTHKLAALAIVAALVAPTVAPASAAAVAVPSTRATPFHPSAGVYILGASIASVILDAMYIAATQCREMTAQEAGAAVIPVLGPAYNTTLAPASQCKK